MPTFGGKTFASFWKNLLGFDQASNTGRDSTTRKIQDGLGQNTAISLSDDVLAVKPETDNTTGTMLVQNKGGSNILAVDTTNSLVKTGASQVNALTLYKEMGLYEFSPNGAGYHYPMITHTVGMQGAEALTYDDSWGNGASPATSLNVSGLTDPENLIAVMWYIHDDITLDSIKAHATCDGSSEQFQLNLMSYDITGGGGNLSNGVLHAVTVSYTGVSVNIILENNSFGITTADIDAGKIVIGFAENITSTDDFSVQVMIKYHIR